MMPEGDPSNFTRIMYGCEANDIAETVFLTPMDSVIKALKEKAENVCELKKFIQGFHANLNGKQISVFNSRVGSPIASDCTYYLRFTPCRKIIYTGLIGSLQPTIRVGDIIVPTAAVRGEGATRYFIEEGYPAVADFKILREISETLDEVYTGCDVKIHYGPIYTTDSFASETREFLELWKSRNLLGIEMETSAIYTIASMYGIKAASFHVVSDNPIDKQSFFDPVEVEGQDRRKICQELVIEALVKLAARI